MYILWGPKTFSIKPFHVSQHTSPLSLTGGRLNSHTNCCPETKPPFLLESSPYKMRVVFLSFVQSSYELANPVPTKAILQPNAAAVMCTAPCWWTHCTSPITPFLLMQNLSTLHDITKSSIVEDLMGSTVIAWAAQQPTAWRETLLIFTAFATCRFSLEQSCSPTYSNYNGGNAN